MFRFRVGDVMSRAPVVVRPTTPIGEAAQAAVDHGVHHLPVVNDDGELIAMICLCDILGARRSATVADHVSWPVIAVGLSASLAEVMPQHGVGSAPVIGPEGALAGLVTRRDLRQAGVIAGIGGVDACARCGATHSLERANDAHDRVLCSDCIARDRGGADRGSAPVRRQQVRHAKQAAMRTVEFVSEHAENEHFWDERSITPLMVAVTVDDPEDDVAVESGSARPSKPAPPPKPWMSRSSPPPKTSASQSAFRTTVPPSAVAATAADRSSPSQAPIEVPVRSSSATGQPLLPDEEEIANRMRGSGARSARLWIAAAALGACAAVLATPSVRDAIALPLFPANLLALEAALSGLASRVERASSGQEALRQLLERDYALIMLDVQMPTMDGFETARLIRDRQRSSRTPIIFITAFDRSDAEILKAYELGAVDFLFKPVLPSVLRAKASVFLDLQRRTSEVARQAEQLRLAEQREHEQNLDEQRRRWEAEALQRQMEDERRVAAELAKRAEELAQTVADRERAERELQRINDELAEADRRKDEFLAVLAHELRNPLAPIVASLELMSSYLRHDGERPTLKRARDAMNRQVQQLVRLVDDLLDVARISSGKIQLTREPIELAEVVQSALTTTQHEIELRGHRLEVELPDAPVTLLADPVRLTQVLANLLNNAAKYTHDGGRIRIQCEVAGDCVSIRVSDNGRGIAVDLVPRVFEMFVQQRQGNGGLGIGLSLVKQLVELHGGSVRARSDGPGEGSEFEVVLPVAPDDIRSSAAASQQGPESWVAEALHIVLVDDNADIRDTLGDLLRAWGNHVSVANDGRRGVELILDERPDLAIVDIGLPGMNGYEVARAVRSVLGRGSTRLVAMSGYGQRQDRERALSAGFDMHLVKPANGAALSSVIRDTAEALEHGREQIA